MKTETRMTLKESHKLMRNRERMELAEAELLSQIQRLKEMRGAAFIIRAVNSHDELLEAVKTMVAYYNDDIHLNGTAIKTMLENAIAKADGLR